ATLKTAGSQTITGTDTITGSIAGTSNAIAVSTAGATHFAVSAPGSATAGSAFSVTVTALDQFNNTATGYVGTVHVTKSDGGGGSAVPANDSFVGGDAGVHTFTNGVTLVTAGLQSVTATDTITGTITGTANVTVNPTTATHLTVSAPGSATAGNSFSFTVTALDAFNNTAAGYAGTVHFTSNDGAATLPANSTLTNGSGTFGVTLQSTGSQSVTATDTIAGSITGSANVTVNVNGNAATHFLVTAPASAVAGTGFSFTVTAQDQFNNTATGYAGTVHFTSSDAAAALPTDATLTNGTATFTATLNLSAGGGLMSTITATDTVVGSITGNATVNVSGNAGVTTHFSVTGPASTTAGVSFNTLQVT